MAQIPLRSSAGEAAALVVETAMAPPAEAAARIPQPPIFL